MKTEIYNKLQNELTIHNLQSYDNFQISKEKHYYG